MSFNSSVFGVESGMCQGWEAGGQLANEILKETSEKELRKEEKKFSMMLLWVTTYIPFKVLCEL